MHYYEVAPNQIIRTNSMFFTYASKDPLLIGTIVTIEIGSKIVIGIIIKEIRKPEYSTKEIISIVETIPVPVEIIALAIWLSDYYVTHLALVLQTILPTGLQKKRRPINTSPHIPLRLRTKNVFTADQTDALEKVAHMSPGTALLHGVTGSGKTAVYIELAAQTLKTGKSTIILVPEIALTSQIVDEFSHHFNNVILAHSKQTEAQRHTIWRSILTSSTPKIIIGPRSALFLPLTNLGLIIIDEAHEPSFKQEQSPRYSALRAASVLAKQHDAKVILGSATPLISDYYLAIQAKRPIIEMNSRAQKDAKTPTVTIIDMTKRQNFKKHRFISDSLLKNIDATISTNSQVLIFHNRRGSASSTLCEQCGWSAACPRCFIPLTLHGDNHELRCHICGLRDKVPTSCPECHSVEILHKGIGTKLIETELRRLFPGKNIARFDGDSESGSTIEESYGQLYDGTIQIIIGTQVVAKGLDLPKLRSVGVIQADAGLSLPDYSSSERTFQLLAQVVGRVGRSNHTTDVIVQSYQPNHHAITFGLAQDYAGFYAHTLTERQRGNFPPFAYILKLTCTYKTETAVIKNTQALANELRQKVASDVQVLGPTPAFYERQRDAFKWQLTLKSPSRSLLVDALKYLPRAHWQFELDPVTLL